MDHGEKRFTIKKVFSIGRLGFLPLEGAEKKRRNER